MESVQNMFVSICHLNVINTASIFQGAVFSVFSVSPSVLLMCNMGEILMTLYGIYMVYIFINKYTHGKRVAGSLHLHDP